MLQGGCMRPAARRLFHAPPQTGMPPRIALLFRGFHAYRHKPQGRSAAALGAFDFRGPWPNIRRTLLLPLQRRGAVTCFAATYESDAPTQAALEAALDLAPDRVLYHPATEGLMQADVLGAGLRMVLVASLGRDFDEVWVARFDVVYKQPLERWPLGRLLPRGVTLPFREHDQREPGLVGDVLLVLSGHWLPLARVFHITQQLATSREVVALHRLARELEAASVPWGTLYDGCFESNTIGKGPECNNPLYLMYGRPYHFGDAPTEE